MGEPEWIGRGMRNALKEPRHKLSADRIRPTSWKSRFVPNSNAHSCQRATSSRRRTPGISCEAPKFTGLRLLHPLVRRLRDYDSPLVGPALCLKTRQVETARRSAGTNKTGHTKPAEMYHWPSRGCISGYVVSSTTCVATVRATASTSQEAPTPRRLSHGLGM